MNLPGLRWPTTHHTNRPRSMVMAMPTAIPPNKYQRTEGGGGQEPDGGTVEEVTGHLTPEIDGSKGSSSPLSDMDNI